MNKALLQIFFNCLVSLARPRRLDVQHMPAVSRTGDTGCESQPIPVRPVVHADLITHRARGCQKDGEMPLHRPRG